MPDEPTIESSSSQPSSSSRTPAVGWAILAVGALAALVDIAIETFWSGSPIRWWVAPPALVLVAASAWLWWPTAEAAKKWGWQGATSWSAGCLLLLLAVSAWIPGGQPNGVRMLLQPTATVFTVVTAAAFLLAAFVLFRSLEALPPTPRLVARCVVAVLAVYALTSLGLALREHASFASLFQGGAAWHRLPRWLQGSFIGALGLLPLAILAQITRFATTLRRQQPVRLLVQQTTALVMSLVMALSGVALPSATTATAHPPDGSADVRLRGAVEALGQTRRESILAALGQKAEAGQSLGQVADGFETACAGVEALLSRLPRASFEVSAIVDQVGRDPSGLFQWVRDETVWVSYRGELRGADGVLMDRVGNSLDRALLLVALLKRAGAKARLAHGTLTPAQVDALTSARRPPDRTPAGGGDEAAILATLGKYLPSGNADVNALRSVLSARRQAATRLFETMREGAQVQASRLLGVVPRSAVQRAEMDRAAAADHWWVQVEEGTKWTDFDPSMHTNEPGASLTAPSETLSPEALDRALRHQVAVRVVIEKFEDGQLSEHVALEELLTPAEIIGVPVKLVNVPVRLPEASELLQRTPFAEALVRWAQNEKEWLPVLAVGTRTVAKNAFTTTGHLLTQPTGGPAKGSQGVSPPPVGTLSGLLGGGEAPAVQSQTAQGAEKGELTAEWIEYEIRVPGKPASKVRRALFDLVGPAARRAGQPLVRPLTESDHLSRALGLLTSTELAVLAGGLSPEFLMWRRAQALLANRTWITRILRPRDQEVGKAVFDGIGDLKPLPGPEFDLAAARGLSDPSAADTYLAEPNIVALHHGLSGTSLETLKGFAAFDIAWNEVAVMRSGPAVAYEVKIKQGAFDSIAENILMATSCCSGGGDAVGGSLPEGILRGKLVAVRSAADIDALSLDQDAKARIEAEVTAGYVVIAPAAASSAPFVWWRVDPSSGSTLAIGDRGWGQGFVEYYFTESYKRGGGMYFAVEFVMTAVCFGLTAVQGIRHQNAGAFAVGLVLCTVGSGFGFGGAATESHLVHGLAWAIEALHYLIESWLEGMSRVEGHGE